MEDDANQPAGIAALGARDAASAAVRGSKTFRRSIARLVPQPGRNTSSHGGSNRFRGLGTPLGNFKLLEGAVPLARHARDSLDQFFVPLWRLVWSPSS
jgi:hypothetical protein